MFKIERPETWEVQERMVSTLEQMQVNKYCLNQTKYQMGKDQVSTGESVLCRLVTKLALSTFWHSVTEMCMNAVLRAFTAGTAIRLTGDVDTSRTPGLTSGFQWPCMYMYTVVLCCFTKVRVFCFVSFTFNSHELN